MIARVLGMNERHRLREIPMPAMAEQVRPEDSQVVVVEEDGRIVASWTVLRMTHLEGAWVDPAYRNAGTVRRLLRKVGEAVREWSNGLVVTSANDDSVKGILDRMNARKVDVETYLLYWGN